PKTAIEWRLLSIIYVLNEEFEKAKESIMNALQIEPNIPQYWNDLGLIHFYLNEFQEAQNAFEKSWISTDSRIPAMDFSSLKTYSYLIFKTYYELGNYEKAIKTSKSYLQFYPNDPIMLNNLASAYNRACDYDNAIEAARVALKIDNNLGTTWRHLGFALYNKGEYDKALECIKKALELKKDYDEACYNLAQVYFSLEQYDDALNACNRCLELNSNHNECLKLKEKLIKF
ncbi:MAG: tetratricopeptide repeat protein, partial [Candidatus Hodarchaeota archaeon]